MNRNSIINATILATVFTVSFAAIMCIDPSRRIGAQPPVNNSDGREYAQRAQVPTGGHVEAVAHDSQPTARDFSAEPNDPTAPSGVDAAEMRKRRDFAAQLAYAHKSIDASVEDPKDFQRRNWGLPGIAGPDNGFDPNHPAPIDLSKSP